MKPVTTSKTVLTAVFFLLGLSIIPTVLGVAWTTGGPWNAVAIVRHVMQPVYGDDPPYICAGTWLGYMCYRMWPSEVERYNHG